MEINLFYDYQSEVFNKVSIIQCLIDAKKMKEVYFLVDELTKIHSNKFALNIFIQDLPMLLEF
jgi:hypothetical protein